jgi:Tfp pilus assembly protein PilN
MKPINLLNQSPQARAYKAVHRWFLFSMVCAVIASIAITWMQITCWIPYRESYLKKRELMLATQKLTTLQKEQQKLALEEKSLKKNVQKLSHCLQGGKNPLTFLNHIKTTLANSAGIEHVTVKNKNIELRIIPNSHETLLSSIASLSQHELCTNIAVAEFNQKEKNKIVATLKSSQQVKVGSAKT